MMSMDWATRRHNSIPRMAWLAACEPGSVMLHHGDAVEIRANTLFEGAWAGDFGSQDFAQASTVVGSGACRSADGVTFVPPSHTLEGLYYHKQGDRLTISNSIPFLLHMTASTPTYDRHLGARFASVVLGIEAYEAKVLSTDRGAISRVLHHNLHWSFNGEISLRPKADNFAFTNYAEYRDALSREIGAVFANAADGRRVRTYEPLSTCSSGYDSTACLVLANELGCRRAVTLARARGGIDDSGQAIAAKLDVELSTFDRMDVAGDDYIHEFLATGMGGEDLIYSCFEEAAAGSVLLTGFHGDKIWSKAGKPNNVLARGDVSGSSMAEFRLRAGFIHLPVPFIAGLHHARICRIANSGEMEPYSIGGWYDRPIPRRIAEEAGIPRDVFGMEKKAASLLIFLARHLQPSGFQQAVDASLAKLPFRERLHARVRERLFVPRLGAARLFERGGKIGGLAGRFALAVRDVLAGDTRIFEHDTPGSFLEFTAALAIVQAHYASAKGKRLPAD